ncbi:MAG: type II secretion system F family protein [Streptosporangiaceae bacterium]
MSVPLMFAAGLAVLSVLSLPPTRHRVVRGRLEATMGRDAGRPAGARGGRPVAVTGRRLMERRGRQVSAALTGLASGLLVGGVSGVLLGAVVGLLLHRVLRRLEPAAVVRRREAVARDTPVAVDLMAACLLAGATLPHAATSVADALGGPVGDALHGVVSTVRLGADPATAWLSLLDEPTLAPLARVMSRAVRSGAPLAETMARFADDQRARRRHAAAVGAQRAGIRAVAPLGLCFLPAFVLLSIVPFVVGVAEDVLSPLT